MMKTNSRYHIVWRPSADEPLASAEVPHLEPTRRAIHAGGDRPVRLPDGRRFVPAQLVSVAELDAQGRVVAAWEVRRHGLDGRHSWLAAWRRVAAATAGLTPEDPRGPARWPVLEALEAAWAWRDVLAWEDAEARLTAALAVDTAHAAGAPRQACDVRAFAPVHTTRTTTRWTLRGGGV